MVTTHRSNAGDQHANDPADGHRLAEQVMPAAHRRQQEQRAADDEGPVGDGSGEPLEIAAGACAHGLQAREATQVTFGNAPQHSPRVAGRIDDQAPHVACKLG